MALVLADRVRETTTTTGTGTVTLAGPVGGFQGFNAAIGNANTTYYTIVDAATGAWEVGLGTYTSSGSTLARTTILSSSNAGAAVNFAAGTKDVFVTQPAERALYLNGAGTGVDAGAAAFTANGVVYASSTSVLATGSALTFDGTEFKVNAASGNVLIQPSNVANAKLYMRHGSIGNNSGFEVDVSSNILFLHAGTEKLRLTATSLYTASGVDVGIGLSNPGGTYGKLTVAGGIRTVDDSSSKLELGRYTSGVPNSYIKLGANSASLRFTNAADSADLMTLTDSGNLGLGVTPSNFAVVKAFQAEYATLAGNSSVNLAVNAYFNSGWKYTAAASALLYTADSGSHKWYRSTSAQVINTDPVFNQAMTLDASGNLGVGPTSPFTRLESAAARATTLNSIASFNTMAASVTDTTAFALGVGGGINFRAQLNASAYNTYASIWSFRESGITDDYKGSLIFGTSDNGDGYPEERMRLESTGNLGIGTSSPGAKLDVATASGDCIVRLGNGTSQARFAVDSSGPYIYALTSGDDSLRVFSAVGSQAMTLTASANLLVGTTANNYSASIIASSAITTSWSDTIALRYNVSGQTNAYYKGMTGTSIENAQARGLHIFNYDQDSNQGIKFYPNSYAGQTANPSMTLDSSGNLGIGTSSPTGRATVTTNASGGVNINESTNATATYGYLTVSQYTNGAFISTVAGSNTASDVLRLGTNNTERARIGSDGTFTFSNNTVFNGNVNTVKNTGELQWKDSGGTAQNVLFMFSDNDVMLSSPVAGSSLIFRGVGYAERARIDSSGNLLVGTTALASGLSSFAQIEASGTTGGVLINSATSNIGRVIFTNNNASGNEGLIRYDGSDYSMQFWTAANERARITSGGDFGIGTTTPGAKLEVVASGSSQQLRLVSTGNSIFRTRWIDATVGFAMESNNSTETAYYPFSFTGSVLRFGTGDGSLKATLDASGNLGLGVTPSVGYGKEFTFSADIASNIGGLGTRNLAANNGLVYLSSNTKNTGAFTDAYWLSAQATKYEQNNGVHAWFNAPSGTAGNTITFTQAMTLDGSGNLGVGITSPFADTNYRSIDLRGTTGGEVVLGSTSVREASITADGTNGMIFNTVNATPLRFYTQGNERARIDSAGNLGVGATSPSTYGKFVVEGTGSFTSAMVSTSSTLTDKPTLEFRKTTNVTSGQTSTLGHISFNGKFGSTAGEQAYLSVVSTNSSNIVDINEVKLATRSVSVGADTAYLSLTSGGNITLYGSANSGTLTYNSGGFTSNANTHKFKSADNTTEYARITSGGDLLVGGTTAFGAGCTIKNSTSTPTFYAEGSATTGSTGFQMYSSGASANRFYVDWAGTVFATTTTISAISDQRLKENVQDLDAGLDKIMALKPRKFDWKAGKGKDIKGDRGFIAQEFEQVFPDMIDTWKDKSPEGEEPYKSVRADLIPVLVKAMQEQQAIITALTARVAALEAA